MEPISTFKMNENDEESISYLEDDGISLYSKRL